MVKKFKTFSKNIIDMMNETEMLTLPSTLAYYFVLSIVPIISILLLIATSFNLSSNFIVEFIEKNFSPELVDLITPMFTNHEFSLGFIVYLIITFFLASNGSDAIIVASNMIFGIENIHPFRRRIKALVLTLLIFLLFTFMFVVPIFGEQILNISIMVGFDNAFIDAIKMLYPVLNIPLTLFVMYFAIKLIYVIAPDEKLNRKHVTKGTIFTTVLWFIVTLGYSYYIKHIANYTAYYAGLSTIVTLMIWFYILAFIFVLGLTMNRTYVEEQIEKTNTIKLKELGEKVKASKEKK